MDIRKQINLIENSVVGMRLTELRHRFITGQKYRKMISAKKRFAVCKDRKSRRQIRHEIRLCQKYWKCYPLHYFRYNLYRNDCFLTDEELIDFIPEFFFYRLFLPHYDSKKYEILLTDKAITEQVFRSLCIPQPPTYAKLINSQLRSESMEPLNFVELEKILSRHCPKKVFIKPLDGMGGYDIYILSRDEQGVYHLRNGGVLDKEFLARISQKRNYIIQPGIEQDKQLSEIYPHSVNTFRILTANHGGETRVLCSTIRIGRAGREVDNSAQDNIVLPVDATTGVTGDTGSTEMGEKFTCHPDTGFLFRGTRIHRWNEIMKFAIASAQKLEQFSYLGWDIALTRNGPMAIETNLHFGLDHYQAAIGGIRRILGIENPSFYWLNRGKR